MKVYEDQFITVLNGDAFAYMSRIPDGSIDLIVADPPYFLSNDGFTNSGGKWVSVNKGDWDRGTSEEALRFYSRLIEEAFRILKRNGTIWVFGTFHSIYIAGYLLQHNDFKIINNVTWRKKNPSPNLSHKMFTHSTETIIWAKKIKGQQIFNDKLMQNSSGIPLTDVWTTSTITRAEKRFGRHPTQKPLAVIERILLSSTTSESIILDPFFGSGTTGVVGKRLARKVIGIDKSMDYLKLAIERIKDFEDERINWIK